MVEGFHKNTARYIDLFAQVADEVMPKRQKAVNPDDVHNNLGRSSGSNSRTYCENSAKITSRCKTLLYCRKMK